MAEQARLLVVGKIHGLYGVRGWVKVYSHTRPKENILRYTPWQIVLPGRSQPSAMMVAESHTSGKNVLVRLEDICERNQAATLLGADILVAREQLPTLPAGEYYWNDLIGLQVVNLQGHILGTVTDLLETGANDVLCVRDATQERLIPLVFEHIVQRIELAEGILYVDWEWEADFS